MYGFVDSIGIVLTDGADFSIYLAVFS